MLATPKAPTQFNRSRFNQSKSNGSKFNGPRFNGDKKPPAEHPILFQKFFKSMGPRTYAAQIKKANNGNQYLVLTEGKRDKDSAEVRKTRLFLYSEDFVEFFRMLHETAQWIKANPVSEEYKQKRQRFWARQNDQPAKPFPPVAPVRRGTASAMK